MRGSRYGDYGFVQENLTAESQRREGGAEKNRRGLFSALPLRLCASAVGVDV
jgi:hypothetical protein